MMAPPNPVFEKHYRDYLRQLDKADISSWSPILDIAVDANQETAQVPFFQTCYHVSPSGVVNERGQRPDYGTCVILLKYLLMCPSWLPSEKDWIPYRDFPDSGQAQNTGEEPDDDLYSSQLTFRATIR